MFMCSRFLACACGSCRIFAFGVGLSTLIGLGWIVFLYLCAGVAVYLALFAVGVVLFLFTVAFAYRGHVGGAMVSSFVDDLVNGTISNIENGLSNTVASGVLSEDMMHSTVDVALGPTDGEMQKLYQALAVVSAILLLLYLVLLCMASGQISRTVALVKEATLVVNSIAAGTRTTHCLSLTL